MLDERGVIPERGREESIATLGDRGERALSFSPGQVVKINDIKVDVVDSLILTVAFGTYIVNATICPQTPWGRDNVPSDLFSDWSNNATRAGTEVRPSPGSLRY